MRLTGEAMHLQTVAPALSGPPVFAEPARLTDNPLVHGAFWTALELDVRTDGAALTTTFLGEHRGASSGPYPRDALEVLPSFHLVAERPLLAGAGVHVGVETGKLADYRPYCGLLIGNLELDVFRAHVRRGPWRLSVSNIADLAVGVGLGIDDGRDYVLALDDVDAGRGCRLDLRAGRFEYLRPGDVGETASDPAEPARTGTTAAAVLRPGRGFGVEAEFSRADRGAGAAVPDARSAWLARVRWSMESGRSRLRVAAERRVYEAAFNDGFFSWSGPVYRLDQVYPLRNTHRPFAQWPVYARYQGRTVRTWILEAEARQPLSGPLALVGQLDLNRLEADGEAPFTYPFYDAGVAWTAAPGLELLATGTNRAMNLDLGHQTLYLLKEPALMLSARWSYAW